MMKKAGNNTVRIAESTWSTCEPQDGVFDFSHVERVMDPMEEAGIHVIIGTPTYAIPTWMVKSHPDVLATTIRGRGIYGPRQIMDITNPTYLFYAERVIRKQFGLDYWSNRINVWEDFPDVRGTINGSLGAEFEKFQRSLVTKFLSWQADIVNEYRREDQFVTHNFDFEWRGYSYGVQPDVDHYQAAKCLTVAGADIYHPTQDELTGEEIAMGGALTRSLKQDNYLILETEAQGGLLSHDFEENAPYREACTIGREFAELGPKLINLKKKNDVAILVSNEALTALKWFGIEATASAHGGTEYNDVMRWIFNTLYHMNVECDFIWQESEHLDQYKVILVPALYAVPDCLLQKLNQYVADGGVLAATFKTAFANENVKVSHDMQPHILKDCLGIRYQQFTFPKQVGLSGEIVDNCSEKDARVFMELVETQGAGVLARYDHYNWKDYAAITKNSYGKGAAYYIGCMTSGEVWKKTEPPALQFNTGRETFLIPMTWGENGWPCVDNENGLVNEVERFPNLPEHRWILPSPNDNFESSTLGMQWNMFRSVKTHFYSLTERPGYLRLKLVPETIADDYTTPSYIARRQQQQYFGAGCAMEFTNTIF